MGHVAVTGTVSITASLRTQVDLLARFSSLHSGGANEGLEHTAQTEAAREKDLGQQLRLVYTTNEGNFHPRIFLDPRPRITSSLWPCRERKVYAHRPAASRSYPHLPDPQEEQPLLVVLPGSAEHTLRDKCWTQSTQQGKGCTHTWPAHVLHLARRAFSRKTPKGSTHCQNLTIERFRIKITVSGFLGTWDIGKTGPTSSLTVALPVIRLSSPQGLQSARVLVCH